MAKKKVKEEHICSECIKGFDGKDIFTAQVPERSYNTNYCEKCIKKLKITEFEPYYKPRKPRAKKETTKKTTTKKTTRKTTKKK